MDQTRVAQLQAMAIFGGVRGDVLELLDTQSREMSREAGEFFVREGEAGDLLYVLLEGQVEVIKAFPSGPRRLRCLGPRQKGPGFGVEARPPHDIARIRQEFDLALPAKQQVRGDFAGLAWDELTAVKKGIDRSGCQFHDFGISNDVVQAVLARTRRAAAE